jgi:hypothetical protein
MDEHSGSALHYGHVGRAIYLPDEQDWIFTRSFARRKYLSLLSSELANMFASPVDPVYRSDQDDNPIAFSPSQSSTNTQSSTEKSQETDHDRLSRFIGVVVLHSR